MTTAAQNASAGVYVSNDVGLEVTDGVQSRVQLGLLPVGTNNYGLRVVSSNGTTVIIDGTSDMFRIAATGTLTVAANAVAGSQTDATATLSTGLTYTPAFLEFANTSTQSIFSMLSLVVTAAGVITSQTFGYCSVVNTNQTFIDASVLLISGTVGSQAVRYYILAQVGI